MATCAQEIQSKITSGTVESITRMVPSTNHPLSINSVKKQLFRLIVQQQETVQFSISLQSLTSTSNVDVSVNFYQIIGTIPLYLGNALITENIITFQKDLTAGEYIICISSKTFAFSGTFVGFFTSYQTYVNLFPMSYAGVGISPFELSFEVKEKDCDKMLYYQIVDGHLPQGLEMTLNGNIYGVLPNLDCVKDNNLLSPSQNWYYNLDSSWHPWRSSMAL